MLAVEPAVARHLDGQLLGERVDDGDADAVQAARDLVAAALAELAAGVEGGEHRLHRRQSRLLVLLHRDAGAVVDHADVPVPLDGDVDAVAALGHRLVDGVVDDLVDQVVEAAGVGGADVHAGAPAHGLQALEHLDVVDGVAVVGGLPRGAGVAAAVATTLRGGLVGAGSTGLRLTRAGRGRHVPSLNIRCSLGAAHRSHGARRRAPIAGRQLHATGRIAKRRSDASRLPRHI